MAATAQAPHPDAMPMAEHQGALRRGVDEGDPLLQVLPGRGVITEVEQGLPEGIMRLQRGAWVGRTLRQPHELFPQLPRRLERSPCSDRTAISPTGSERAAASRRPGCTTPAPGCRSAPPPGPLSPWWPSAPARGAICRSSSCWARAGVSGRVVSSSSPVVRCCTASRLAERWMACCPARCQ